jgi:hypothetical protein
MKSRICAKLLECLRLNTMSKENQAQTSIAVAEEREYSSLKRLNDLRLQQLSTGWTEAHRSQAPDLMTNQAPDRSKDAISSAVPSLAVSETSTIPPPQTIVPQPVISAPLPAVPSDSFSRLEAFIAAKHLESPTPGSQCEIES